jgi:hypothetical protein
MCSINDFKAIAKGVLLWASVEEGCFALHLFIALWKSLRLYFAGAINTCSRTPIVPGRTAHAPNLISMLGDCIIDTMLATWQRASFTHDKVVESNGSNKKYTVATRCDMRMPQEWCFRAEPLSNFESAFSVCFHLLLPGAMPYTPSPEDGSSRNVTEVAVVDLSLFLQQGGCQKLSPDASEACRAVAQSLHKTGCVIVSFMPPLRCCIVHNLRRPCDRSTTLV